MDNLEGIVWSRKTHHLGKDCQPKQKKKKTLGLNNNRKYRYSVRTLKYRFLF